MALLLSWLLGDRKDPDEDPKTFWMTDRAGSSRSGYLKGRESSVLIGADERSRSDVFEVMTER